jgi:hypothetical protein
MSMAQPRRRWITGLILVLVTSSGCGGAPASAPASAVATSTDPLPTSALEQWPPVSNRGPAPGITIVLRDRTVVMTNESADSYWLSPPIIELWEGGAPWIVVVEPGDGSLELGPGDELELVIGDRSDTVRAGARLWPDAIIDGSEEPWFNWLEVEANQ